MRILRHDVLPAAPSANSLQTELTHQRLMQFRNVGLSIRGSKGEILLRQRCEYRS
jgi:hypothetical protein